MSDYSSTYPTQSPTFAFDAKAGKLDSRISYSRSSTGTAFSSERHLSSENLIPYSNDLSQSVWTKRNLTVPATNIAAPDGTSSASSLLETVTSASHDFYEEFSAVSGTSYTFTLYAKANGRDTLRIVPQATSNLASVDYDLTAVTSTVASGSADSHSITAIGSTGWYKLQVTVTATGSGTGFLQTYFKVGGSTSYAGDPTKGAYIWGCQVSSTGQTVVNETSGSIHRQFAPTLKTAAADEPRFEFDASGNSEGLLIEAQATNLTKYSDDFSSWGGLSTVVVTSNAGVAPSGQLEADLLVSPSSALAHYILDSTIDFTSGTTYTASVYVKSAGHRYVQICGNTAAFGASPYQWVNYDLEAGTLSANNCSGTITAVGNGYYRVTATMTATVTSTQSFILMFADSLSSGFFPTTTGDAYSGFLAFGFQTEASSAPSSLISTSGATATRSADSCSVATSSFYTGGPVSVIAEANMPSDNVGSAVELSDGTSQNRASMTCRTDGSQALTVVNAGGTQAYIGNTTLRDGKRGMRIDNNNFGYVENGGTVITDTSGVVPVTDTLELGRAYNGNELNGYLKRVSLYSVALSDVELQSLTSNP